MSSSAAFTMTLPTVRRVDRQRVGGKAANLGELLAAGLPVPCGFCVTTTAFDRFRASDGGTLAEAPVPKAVRDAVLSVWRELGEAKSVAVRSSATVEDGREQSFAGQFESVLNVRGAEALLDAVKSCWLSLFSKRALAYLARQQIPVEKVKMAVLVQEMVEAERAGVVFTADPLTGATDRLVVEYVSGLGDSLVQGMVQPERIVIDRQATFGNFARLCELALQTERLFGGPQDVEWAERGGEVFLLQARPITTRKTVKTWEDRQVWTNSNTGEVAPDVTTPVTWSMIESLLYVWFDPLARMAGADIRLAPPAGLVAGRIYFNANTLLATIKPFSFLLKRVPNSVQAFGGGQFEKNRETPLSIPWEDLPDLGFRWPKYILSWPRILCDLISHSRRRGEAWILRAKARVDKLTRVDVETMSTAALAGFVARGFRQAFEGWDLLYFATPAVALPVFQKACRDWLRDPGLTLAYRLFSALGGMPTVEAGLALWRLAVLAHADGGTEVALSSGTGWPQVRATLQRAEHGRQFLAAWDAFMVEHGHHCRGELELFNARWCETPDYVLSLVRGYLRSVGQSDPLENQRRLAVEREQLTAQCRQRLKNPVKRWIFSRSLGRVQKLAVFREQLKNLAVRQIVVLRLVLLALGRRLCEQGTLSRSEDIFFLEVTEIEPVATGTASFDWRQRVARRRQEYERNQKLSPPPVVVGRFDPHANDWPVAGPGTKTLEGIPVSPGVVTGKARVILRTDDHEQVFPGEILIAPFTDPAWTPYFINAAGVVMDQGGILSHGSIIAREYGLPAVTNVGSATRVIRTGDPVQVDGNRGRVTVLRD